MSDDVRARLEALASLPDPATEGPWWLEDECCRTNIMSPYQGGCSIALCSEKEDAEVMLHGRKVKALARFSLEAMGVVERLSKIVEGGTYEVDEQQVCIYCDHVLPGSHAPDCRLPLIREAIAKLLRGPELSG